MRVFITIIAAGLLTCLPLSSQSKYEIRAAWLTTIGALDFPDQKANSAQGVIRQKRELCRILDLNDGENLEGEVPERYFSDCLKKLKEDSISKAIEEVKKQFAAADGVEEKRQAAALLQQLVKQKEKLKSGDIR